MTVYPTIENMGCNLGEAQWPIGYGVGLRIKRSSVRIRPWPLRWVLGQGSLLSLSQGEAFTLASVSYLAILVKYILAKKKKKKTYAWSSCNHDRRSQSCRQALWACFQIRGTKTSTTCSFLPLSVALKALHTCLLIFFFLCVWSFPVFLSVFPHLSGFWYFRHGFELLFLATFPPCVFRRFFQSSTLHCREHDMLHYCTFFDRGKRIEHCQQGRTRLLNPVILHLFSIIITIKTQMKNTS